MGIGFPSRLAGAVSACPAAQGGTDDLRGGISLPCGKAGAGTDAGVEAADHAASAGANAKNNGISAPICSAA